jgi:hypothetical protein
MPREIDKNKEAQVNIAGLWTEICTQDLPNTKQESVTWQRFGLLQQSSAWYSAVVFNSQHAGRMCPPSESHLVEGKFVCN